MPPATLLGGLAAENDLRTLRIPNRLVAVGAALMALTLGFVAAAFNPAVVAPAIIGAAILAVPLFLNHVLSSGRSGLGDAKLAAVLGLVVGAVHPSAAIGALLASTLLGSAFGAIWRRRRRGGFPLAPALAVGTTPVRTRMHRRWVCSTRWTSSSWCRQQLAEALRLETGAAACRGATRVAS
jgi:Flp pilus assembly protein protease CpaA